MKNMVEELLSASKSSSNVAYMTFIRHLNKDKWGLFCFLEGKDSPYYAIRVKNHFQSNYYPIHCGGKEKVLKVYELIRKHPIEYGKAKTAFFVDSDFDEPLNNTDIYETPCYSIENLYTSSAVLGEILKSECRLYEIDEDFEHCISLYESLQNDFHSHTTLFNAWYACVIRFKNRTQEDIDVPLDDKFPKKFVQVSLSGITASYDLTAICVAYPQAPFIDDQTIAQKVSEMNIQNKGKIFRGKFEFYFMLTILDELIKDSQTTRSIVKKNIKYHINHSNAISQLAQYAETPPDLISYIQNRVQ
ncbi:MAG: DUF4435 domain-containing protein [Chitinophagales bacterium]|jgi:hypothetical protein|nr:DUF4435 domain-containing protein [Chitinophagales bacterium]HNI43545.1 DUF4435 domain-containing protein [Chitinophagales bacterium]HNL06097.1 DUF4435 domain-containing protein [Chitinophagales bacterium]